MEKKFAFFKPHVDEEKDKLRKCSYLRNGEKIDFSPPDSDLCESCRVFLMSDRFMGENYYEKTGIPKNTYPFVLISDAAGCNLDCWFCYSHKLIDRKDYEKQRPESLSPDELANCYLCKMGSIANNFKALRDNVYSRIRVTGGEPLFSDEDTLSGDFDDLFEATVDYWIRFFQKLNSGINELEDEGKIKLLEPREVKELRKNVGEIEDPVWITEHNGSITLRFDTNGLLFADEKRAKKFIESLFELHKDGKADNLYIEINYSLKGASPDEFYASQGKELDENLEENFEIENHPQYEGLENYYKIKSRFLDRDESFDNTLGITIERGIQNQGNTVYLYSEDSLKWDLMEKKFQENFKKKYGTDFGFHLSEVENVIYCIGKGAQPPTTYFHRYNNPKYGGSGTKIVIRWDDGQFEIPADDSEGVRELEDKRKKLKDKGKDYRVIFIPEGDEQHKLSNFG